MSRFTSRKLTFVLFLIFFVPLTNYSQDKIKNIVIFFSYGPNITAFENILAGLKKTIGRGKEESLNIMTEYLDLDRTENDDYARDIINMYNKKLNEFKVDLLITIGPGLNDALMKYGSSTMKGLDIINIDLDIPGRTALGDLNIKNGKEIILKFKAGETLKAAFALFPQYRNVYVISGVSRIDAFYTSLIRKNTDEFLPFHTFTFISNLSLDSTIRYVRTIPPNSIIIVPSYLQDATRVPFSTPEVMEMISRNSHAPVFLTITDAGVKTRGGIGGYLFSYINLGKETGKIAREVLGGKQLKEITIHENNFYEYFYDWDELKRWHLTDSKAIPANSIFYNRDRSFFGLYKWYLLGLLVFITFQTMLIIYLFRLNRRQKAINLKMEETESMYRELIRTDRLSKMSTLTASLSHELFQPLAAIRYTAEAGQHFAESDKLDAKKAFQLFDNILEDNIRATKIITSVKGLMKTDTPVKESVNLNVLIHETADLIKNDIKKIGILIKIVFEADPVFVFGSKIQLQQVLMNFIRNGASAVEKNDPQNRRLEIFLKVENDEAILQVIDSGPGIDMAIKGQLFKPFISTKKDGFGIGLTLCKSLIENHKGKIWAENLPEGGALFAFSLKVIKI
jgi:signal transduction histidine kinase